MLKAFFLSLRPKQWTKNGLLFAGIVFAQRWHIQEDQLAVLAAFLIFCALSGVVYIFNDILDVEKDRMHPKKKHRPIASGAISPAMAGAGAFVLCAAALTGAYFITFPFFISAIIYVALVSAYSLALKHMVILDILAIALGFVVRAMAGVEALNGEVEITPFFILTTLFLALFLAVGKRRAELAAMADKAESTRKVLKEYTVQYLDMLLTLVTAGVIGSYAGWAVMGDLARVDGVYTMAFTMPFVLYGIFRYLWLVYTKGEGEAPDQLLLSDQPLKISVLLWLIAVFALLSISPPDAAESNEEISYGGQAESWRDWRGSSGPTSRTELLP